MVPRGSWPAASSSATSASFDGCRTSALDQGERPHPESRPRLMTAPARDRTPRPRPRRRAAACGPSGRPARGCRRRRHRGSGRTAARRARTARCSPGTGAPRGRRRPRSRTPTGSRRRAPRRRRSPGAPPGSWGSRRRGWRAWPARRRAARLVSAMGRRGGDGAPRRARGRPGRRAHRSACPPPRTGSRTR
ncbi:hypothetical protein B7486_69410 [cyanobacterium TDX16]|nr:hypothetical protein B7486_69410 [cyanobacterium TDX16]